MNNLKIALTYLEKGISVTPLRCPEMVKKSPPFAPWPEIEAKDKSQEDILTC